MYQRFLEDRINQSNMPVIFINGARQVGKSTLVKSLFATTHDYFTLDDPQILFLAKNDPLKFIKNIRRPIIIDEVQRCPDLLLAIKMTVDEARIPKQFILTGSVNLLNLHSIKDSLAGRMVVYNLWPLSQEEIRSERSGFLEELMLGNIKKPAQAHKVDIAHLMQKGGYPLVLNCTDDFEAQEWLKSYLTHILEKDIRDLSNIEGLSFIPNILSLLASRVGSMLNISDISRSLQIPNTSLRRYLNLLQMTHLFVPLKPWFTNLGKRLTKAEKIYLNDSALLELVLGKTSREDPVMFGHVLENFIFMELKKQLSYKRIDASLYYFRTLNGEEVDFILESPNRDIVAIEVKSSSNFSNRDSKGLKLLNNQLKDKFKIGIILYGGDNILPIDDKISAVPLSYLWS